MDVNNAREEITTWWISGLVYSFMILIILGNIVCFVEIHLTSPSQHTKNCNKYRSCTNFDLHQFRKLVNRDTRLKALPVSTIQRIRSLNRKHKCGKRAGLVTTPLSLLHRSNSTCFKAHTQGNKLKIGR